MNTDNTNFPWLDFIKQPAFCVKDGKIIAINSAAQARMIEIDTPIQELITENYSDYAAFQNGNLYLPICICGISCKADVSKIDGYDVFILDQTAENEQLQSLALAAQQLRIPLVNVITITDLLWDKFGQTSPKVQDSANQIKQNLYQLMRIVGNMSDAGFYQNTAICEFYPVNLTALFQEIIDEAQLTTASTGIPLSYCGMDTAVITLANNEKLERAIFNMLSNAMKFTENKEPIEVTFTANETTASFSVCNSCTTESNQSGIWTRYDREPTIEDSRNGLGLGMALITSTAISHGGTVLVDYPSKGKIRVTMTIAIRNNASTDVHSPVIKISDYAGSRDKTLLEFSELLSPDSYSK